MSYPDESTFFIPIKVSYDLVIMALSGPQPVECLGRIQDRQFYFRAASDYWSMTVARQTGVDPLTLYQQPYLPPNSGWKIKSKMYNAGRMNDERATGIIIGCAEAFLRWEEEQCHQG